jgi:hypothetical protein
VQPAFFPAPPSPYARPAPGEQAPGEFQLQIEPPGLERIARLDNDAAFEERIRQESSEPVSFPPEPILSRDTYAGRGGLWPQRQVTVEPNYVCYGKLLFEEKNGERYGWDLGVLQPLASAGAFFGDVALLPYHLGTGPFRCHECSAGYCLPGDPVPYLLYPPELSLTGAVAEVGVIMGLVAIFP